MSNLRKTGWPKRLLILALAISGAAYGGWYYQQNYYSEGANYQTEVVSRGEMLQVVTASGQLNPVVKVEVGSQISGIVQSLLVDFNAQVKTGQVIARIDSATYEASFIQAEGNLASANAALELARLNADRAKALRADKLNPQADYDKALADLHQAEANVKINEGALKKAQADLARCTIYSPIEGIIISRNVSVGQTVAASLSAPTLFVIANDLAKMQIEANVAEADIGLVKDGQEVEFTVDAFRGKTFHGKVSQIRNAPKTDQNVVTYDTIIEVGNPELKLKPGMTANVSIITARRENALRIVNAALRFRPPAKALLLKGQSTSDEVKSKAKTSSARHRRDKQTTERMVYILASNVGSTNRSDAVSSQRAALECARIQTGLTDGSYTEVLGGVKEGDEVVTGLITGKVAAARQSTNPFSAARKRN